MHFRRGRGAAVDDVALGVRRGAGEAETHCNGGDGPSLLHVPFHSLRPQGRVADLGKMMTSQGERSEALHGTESLRQTRFRFVTALPPPVPPLRNGSSHLS